MGPDIAIEFQGSRYDPMSPLGDITFWRHPSDNSKFVLIYTMFDPKSDHMDHCSVDLSEVVEAQPYFDRAVIVTLSIKCPHFEAYPVLKAVFSSHFVVFESLF